VIKVATYWTKGSCSREIIFSVNDDDVLTDVKFLGGCSGNQQAVARLTIGKKTQDIITLLQGIKCRNGTSCPDQLSQALTEYNKKKAAK
jgi:uncharacterized protein (TIGR03905 family)